MCITVSHNLFFEDKSSLRVVVKLNSSSDTKHRDIIKKLNKMQAKINVGQQTIELESASSGSIVITATVKWYQIRDHDHFNTELISFIRRSLKAVGKQLKHVCDANIVVVVDNSADDCKESDEKIHDWKGKKKMKLRSDSSKSMKPESNIEWLDHEIAVEGHEDAEKDYILELPNNITEKKLFMIIKKLEKDTSNRSLTVLVKKDDTSANFLKKTDFDFESVRNKEVQIEAAKSVGIIRGPKCTGTGWRVGPDYVITAWHVVKDNTVADSNENDIEDRVQNDTFNIQFHYKEENQFDTSKFKFDKIVFFNDELDTAILKLSCKRRTILPPKIDKFRKIASSDKKELCLVGHPSGKPQTVDSKIQFYQLDVAHLRKVKKYALQHFSDGNTYERMDNTKFILYNCYSTHGSSGSVGIVIEESHKDPVAVLMHLSGYPRNAYDGTLQKAEIQTLKENGNIIEVEQGVKIESIFEAMETTHSDLRREIFGSVNQFQ
ncbi:Hypothetical predicted protein [Mytilus galloprovincialis]|uniref:Peptidase S1 domain-containing protein n=1 Tax=Mytilus galloprovincialis TaxID=29158 RepID=A0A8B6CRJ4_MYTGA|nr:Hypothetical predicted protein [Mytilus galloprovincialis]